MRQKTAVNNNTAKKRFIQSNKSEFDQTQQVMAQGFSQIGNKMCGRHIGNEMSFQAICPLCVYFSQEEGIYRHQDQLHYWIVG